MSAVWCAPTLVQQALLYLTVEFNKRYYHTFYLVLKMNVGYELSRIIRGGKREGGGYKLVSV